LCDLPPLGVPLNDVEVTHFKKLKLKLSLRK